MTTTVGELVREFRSQGDVYEVCGNCNTFGVVTRDSGLGFTVLDCTECGEVEVEC